jgi:hypothetical protein
MHFHLQRYTWRPPESAAIVGLQGRAGADPNVGSCGNTVGALDSPESEAEFIVLRTPGNRGTEGPDNGCE